MIAGGCDMGPVHEALRRIADEQARLRELQREQEQARLAAVRGLVKSMCKLCAGGDCSREALEALRRVWPEAVEE